MTTEPNDILFTRIEPQKPVETIWPTLPDNRFEPSDDPLENYRLWINSAYIGDALKREARALTGASSAEDCLERYAAAPADVQATVRDSFGSLLDFGTAGLRGELGPGFNRMNRWTVGTTVQALADVLKEAYKSRDRKQRYVAIGYDTRHRAEEFARLAAGILLANDISVALFKQYSPTPLLAYATHRQNCLAGLMITASHNPRQYSGVKFYEEGGIQMGESLAQAVSRRRSDSYVTLPDEKIDDHERLEPMSNLTETNYKNFLVNHLHPSGHEDQLKLIYTPLHGTGARLVLPLLEELQFSQVITVEEQLEPDPDFPTAPAPNPEQEAAMALARAYAERHDADIVFATDPDADRLAVMVPDAAGQWQLLSGNQVGALLTWYYIRFLKDQGRLPELATLVTSVVTDRFGAAIAKSLDVQHVEALTGFKNICGKIREFEATGKHAYIMGYEESIGYALGQEVLDKDGISALVFLAHAAAREKAAGHSLWERLQVLQEEHGYFVSQPERHSLAGEHGQRLKDEVMRSFRHLTGKDFRRLSGPGADLELVLKDDYLQQRSFTYETSGETLVVHSQLIDELRSDVLRFFFADGSWFAIRPSGTEPTLKFYFYGQAQTEEAATKQAERLADLADRVIQEIRNTVDS